MLNERVTAIIIVKSGTLIFGDLMNANQQKKKIDWNRMGECSFSYKLCFNLYICAISLKILEQFRGLKGEKNKKGRQSLENTSFNQDIFYGPAIPMGLLDFGGCEVTCVNVPPRGREASTN